MCGKVQDEMVHEKTLEQKAHTLYQDSWHLLQNPKVHKSVMGFRHHAQRFTGPNYLDVSGCKREPLIISLRPTLSCSFFWGDQLTATGVALIYMSDPLMVNLSEPDGRHFWIIINVTLNKVAPCLWLYATAFYMNKGKTK